MSDLISRQAAIDALSTPHGILYPIRTVEELPAVQPEITRCCKCVYWQQNTIRQNSNDAGWWNEALCEKHTIYGNEPHEAWVDADWFCADAERRTDDQT